MGGRAPHLVLLKDVEDGLCADVHVCNRFCTNHCADSARTLCVCLSQWSQVSSTSDCTGHAWAITSRTCSKSWRSVTCIFLVHDLQILLQASPCRVLRLMEKGRHLLVPMSRFCTTQMAQRDCQQVQENSTWRKDCSCRPMGSIFSLDCFPLTVIMPSSGSRELCIIQCSYGYKTIPRWTRHDIDLPLLRVPVNFRLRARLCPEWLQITMSAKMILWENHRRHECALQVPLAINLVRDDFQLHGTCHIHLAYSSLRLWGVRRRGKAQDRVV